MPKSHSIRAPFFSESNTSAPGEIRQDASEFNVIFVHSRLDDYGLPAPAFRVYCHLARRAGRGSAWPAVAGIARICRLHPQTVRKALRLLTAHRLLLNEPRHGTTTIYRLTPASAWRPPTRIDGNPSETDTPVSVSQGSPVMRIQGQPSETNADEGNPLGGNPGKELQTNLVHHVPSSEVEAVKEACALGVPADFARQEFNRMVSVAWLDGCKRWVKSWPHYIKQRWSREQSERGDNRTTGRTSAKRAPQPPRQFHAGDYHQSVKNF